MRIELYPNGIPAKCAEDDFVPYLDTFLLDAAKTPLGAVLVLPGGGYHHRAPHEGDPVARRFNDLGYHAFVLQYRVQPSTAPAPQLDVVRALKIIRANAEKWYLQPDKIAVCGFSAGGHLAACAGMLADKYIVEHGDEADSFSGKADAMLLCYAVLDAKSREIRPGSPYADTDGIPIDPCTLVDDTTVPAYVWHTAGDANVNCIGSVDFAREMWKRDRVCELHVFPEGPHGRGLGFGFSDIISWSSEAAVFLETHCNFRRGAYSKHY